LGKIKNHCLPFEKLYLIVMGIKTYVPTGVEVLPSAAFFMVEGG
jgi:hypothetical protein